MKISYNWLKSYIPEAPKAEKLADIFTYHVCEVEDIEKREDEDFIFDIKILPNRAHDLLSHYGIAQEIASLLNIKFIDPISKYKIPHSTSSGQTSLKIEIDSSKCRRYMGRIIRNVKVGPSPEWVVKHLESIGQRSINNMVDAANLVMFDVGQPTHIFDLDKISSRTILGNSEKDSPLLVIRQAKDGENLITLDNKDCKLKSSDLIIADSKNVLAIAGIKGGKMAEVDDNTKDIILEVANFDPTSVRKTAQALNIFTDAKKRFENDLSPELGSYAMLELSALIFEMCPMATFEEIVDVYPLKQKEQKLYFSVDKISKILGTRVSIIEVGNILERYKIGYKNDGLSAQAGDKFEIVVPPMRLDLAIEEDMAEEIGRIMGYDKVIPNIPKINFKPKENEIYQKISLARNKLLNEGYSEIMTYAFCDKGEVSVLASASDKKFLRTNLSDGLKESIKLNNTNAPLLGLNDIKVFEIGTIFKKDHEEIHVAYESKKEVKEMSLDEYTSQVGKNSDVVTHPTDGTLADHNFSPSASFHMWSLFPFIVRDVAVWVGEGVKSDEVVKIIKENMSNMVIRGPELFDEFKKDGKISYAFRLIFQSYDRTLTDVEINEVMTQITNKIKEKNDWQVR